MENTMIDIGKTFQRRAWYHDTREAFQKTSVNEIIGVLTRNSAVDCFEVTPEQADAWQQEIEILKGMLPTHSECDVYLEFNIPRVGRRIDALMVFEKENIPYIVILEFKVGERKRLQSDLDQVWDYALDLKNFHKGSHHAKVIPILIATEAPAEKYTLDFAVDHISVPLFLGKDGARNVLNQLFSGYAIRMVSEWENTPYCPTPTIIEAARSLYAQHSVENITRNDAGAKNLTLTSTCVMNLIKDAAHSNKKLICFVTGVPGAGKTLVGLDIATTKHDKNNADKTHAVYLSGNGPLVAVLSEALVRDEMRRAPLDKDGKRKRKGTVAIDVKSFIQNVHHFRDEAIRNSAAPDEHVVIFDEAQRAWNLSMTRNFMQRKKGLPNFNQSEPEFLISYMDRRRDWAVIICLVGGGQEINTGEAGISAWIEAVRDHFPQWHLAISDKLLDSEYGAGKAVDAARSLGEHRVTFHPELHLSVSMRSFRSEKVSEFVKTVLDLDAERSKALFSELTEYPICITRDLRRAKQWLRSKSRGTERYGLLASSKAMRLKPYAIDVAVDADPVHYFLDGKDDPRSSYYLECVATEFQVQGLELDWACVAWDGDLRKQIDNGWSHHDFRGNRWQNIKNTDNRSYLKNAYRVLLTRARQGMVIFVPPGNNPPDATRDSSFLDGTYAYLKSIGIPELTPISATQDKGY